MKKLLALCVGVVVLCVAATAFAFAPSDLTGTWTGEIKSPDGSNSFQITFVLKQEGEKLTGTVQGPQGDPTPIANGKVDGDKFSFDVTFNNFTITHSGTVSGDEIKMTTKASSGDFPATEMTLKRAPAAETAPASPPAAK